MLLTSGYKHEVIDVGKFWSESNMGIKASWHHY